MQMDDDEKPEDIPSHYEANSQSFRPGEINAVKGDTVNIEGGTISNVVNISVPSAETEPSEKELNEYGKIFTTEVNKRTKEECEKYANIALGMINTKTREIKSQVFPELTRTEFFEGAAGLDEVNYSANATPIRITKKKREAQVFVKEIHNQGRYVLLVGSAGSGKTTLAKRYSLMALRGETTKRFNFVHFVNIRDTRIEKCTPRKFLFEDILIGDRLRKCLKIGYSWLQDESSQETVLFVFDGLDTAPWYLDDTYHSRMGYNDEEMPAKIMFNLLRGHLFPKVTILLTSREYGVCRLRPELRPNATVAMRGLTAEDMKTLVKDLGGDSSLDIWKSIEDKSQNLMQLCSNPLFLTFAILIHHVEKRPPKSFSGIIVQLLKRHIRSTNRRMPQEEVDGILHKLKSLSYSALRRKSVVFSIQDLKEVGLTPDEVKDLVIGSPRRDISPLDQLLLPKDFHYFFCHQAIQEAFAAQHVSEMNNDDFDNAATKYLRDRSGTVVRQFACGILFGEEKNEAPASRLEVETKIAKRAKVLQILEEDLLRHADNPLELLNLLISLRECGNDEDVKKMVKKTLTAIRLSDVALTPSDLHAVGRIASHCDKLSIMQLENCQLQRQSVEILVEVMKYSDVEITVFDVSFNSNLRKDSMYYIHKICIRGQGLNYWQCGFRQHHILNFVNKDPAKSKDDIKIESTEERIKLQFYEDHVLDLESYNVKNHFEILNELASHEPPQENLRVNIIDFGNDDNSDMERLCDLLSRCDKIFELAISDSKLDRTDVGSIAEAVKNKTIPSLNVYLCPEIHPVGWSAMGQLVANCRTKNVFLTACSLEDDKLKVLKLSLEENEAKVIKLDISRNYGMHSSCLSEIGEIMENCRTKELVAGYCNLQCGHLTALAEPLLTVKLDRIDLSGNVHMGPDGFRVLGEIVTKCETKQLDISECDPGCEELKGFKEATKLAKLEKLNVSRNRAMGSSGLRQVAEMTGQYVLKDLLIRQCELNEEKLQSFQQALPTNSKIVHLGLGLYFMKKKRTTMKEIEILKAILPHVDKTLTLNGWDLTVEMKQSLKIAIDDMSYRGLQIVFDRGLQEIIAQRRPDAATD